MLIETEPRVCLQMGLSGVGLNDELGARVYNSLRGAELRFHNRRNTY